MLPRCGKYAESPKCGRWGLRKLYLPCLYFRYVVHYVQLEVVRAAAVAGWSGQPCRGVTARKDPRGSHRNCRDRFPTTVPAQERRRHFRNRYDRVTPSSWLRRRGLWQRRQERSFLRRRTRPFASSFTQTSHLFRFSTNLHFSNLQFILARAKTAHSIFFGRNKIGNRFCGSWTLIGSKNFSVMK